MKSKRRRLECSEAYARRHYLKHLCKVGFEGACLALRHAVPDYSPRAEVAIADGVKALAKRSTYQSMRAVTWAEFLLSCMEEDHRLPDQVRQAAKKAERWRTNAYFAQVRGDAVDQQKLGMSWFLRALRRAEIEHLGDKK